MLSLIVSVVSGVVAALLLRDTMSDPWVITCGVATFFVVQLIIGLIIRQRMGVRQDAIQQAMSQAQDKINRQMVIYQRRPPSSMREAQETVNRIQTQAAHKMLEILDGTDSLCLWNFMLKRQINAMRVQLYFQLKEFKKVDQLLPKALLLDQQSLAIKLVRTYRNDDFAGLETFYRKKCRKLKGDGAAFLSCVYAWMLLKQNDAKAAIEVLTEAKKKSDNAVLLDNLDKLLNGKVKHFSNSGFGDAWYALYLEEPKVKAQRQTGRMF